MAIRRIVTPSRGCEQICFNIVISLTYVFYLILVLVYKFYTYIICLVVSDFSLLYMYMISCVLSTIIFNDYVMLCYVILTPSNTRFLEPKQIRPPNSILIS